MTLSRWRLSRQRFPVVCAGKSQHDCSSVLNRNPRLNCARLPAAHFPRRHLGAGNLYCAPAQAENTPALRRDNALEDRCSLLGRTRNVKQREAPRPNGTVTRPQEIASKCDCHRMGAAPSSIERTQGGLGPMSSPPQAQLAEHAYGSQKAPRGRFQSRDFIPECTPSTSRPGSSAPNPGRSNTDWCWD